MPDRSELATRFLSKTDWADSTRNPLAGDASNRRYERVENSETGLTAVLMDAPPERGEDVSRFVRIARYLGSIGLSAPEVLAQDSENGFLLLEDLGDDLFARVISANPTLEKDLYQSATDVLLALHEQPLEELEPYSVGIMTEMSSLAFSKYRNGIVGDSQGQSEFAELFGAILTGVEADDSVLIQRDYHAENLLWLPQRNGIARVGLLDFQDAMSGHPAYDLVSLLQDARRDVAPEIETQMISYYVDRSGQSRERFEAAYAVLGTQRNLRILGVFTRLGLEYGKPHYVDFIPRVWSYLERDLNHPELAPVAALLRKTLPEPTSENLSKLKSK